MKYLSKRLSLKPLIIGLACILGSLVLFSSPAKAQVNVSKSFKVTFDGVTNNYSPGMTVNLYTPAIKDNQYFAGFSYSSEIIHPGVSYGASTKRFIFSFIMPSCDVNIATKYNTQGWVVNANGTANINTETDVINTSGYGYVDNGMISEKQSGYNQKVYPGDNVVTTYSGSTVNVTIDGQQRTYIQNQPVVIIDEYIYNKTTGVLVTGYSGTNAVSEQTIYTGTNGKLYIQTVYPAGFTSAVELTRILEQGCVITVSDTSGNTFYREIVQKGDATHFALPTRQGDYTISNVTATDPNGRPVAINTQNQTNGNTVIDAVAPTNVDAVNISFTWHDVNDKNIVNTPQVVTTKTNVLSSRVVSTGIIESYTSTDLFTPAAKIDADDIQKNRDDIIILQKALSDSDGSGTEAVYFFHDPTITNDDGTTTKLEGWFMQKGSNVPKANDSWLQVG